MESETDAICDGCRVRIFKLSGKGARWRCRGCNYDLCQRCRPLLAAQHPHPLSDDLTGPSRSTIETFSQWYATNYDHLPKSLLPNVRYLTRVLSRAEYVLDPKKYVQTLVDERGGEEVLILGEDPALEFLKLMWGVVYVSPPLPRSNDPPQMSKEPPWLSED